MLREAVLTAASAGQDVARAYQRLEQIETHCRAAENELQAARETVLKDATDLQLPNEPSALMSISDAVDRFSASHQQLLSAAREWLTAHPEHAVQREREIEACDALTQFESTRAETVERAERTRARFETLQNAVGQQVELLRQQLAAARSTVDAAEGNLD